MSRATCPKCGNTNVSWIRDDADCAQYICLECKQVFCYPPKTLFYHITASPEVLAPCFVEKQPDKWDEDDYPYYSYLTKEWYATEDKAITATIEELKKEYKG